MPGLRKYRHFDINSLHSKGYFTHQTVGHCKLLYAHALCVSVLYIAHINITSLNSINWPRLVMGMQFAVDCLSAVSNGDAVRCRLSVRL
jgi:hypothetical protein